MFNSDLTSFKEYCVKDLFSCFGTLIKLPEGTSDIKESDLLIEVKEYKNELFCSIKVSNLIGLKVEYDYEKHTKLLWRTICKRLSFSIEKRFAEIMYGEPDFFNEDLIKIEYVINPNYTQEIAESYIINNDYLRRL